MEQNRNCPQIVHGSFRSQASWFQFRCHGCLSRVDRLFVVLVEQMGVDVEGDRGVLMPQTLADLDHVDASVDEHGSMSVPQGVKIHARKIQAHTGFSPAGC